MIGKHYLLMNTSDNYTKNGLNLFKTFHGQKLIIKRNYTESFCLKESSFELVGV